MTPPVPEGFHTVTPHLVVKGAARAIDFYRRAFGAQEIFRMPLEGTDVILHARLRIGDSFVMLNDEFPQSGATAPPEQGGGVAIHLYVEDVDSLYRQALDAGADVLFPLEDTFWGDRYAMVKDPFGHRWSLATCRESLTPEEMHKRARTAFSGGPQS